MAGCVFSALSALLLSACAPELNWRELSPAQADGLKAQFPCKPDTYERRVPWPGVPDGVLMHLMSCQSQERTWALSYFTLPDVGLVGPALRQWPDIMRRNLAQASGSSGSGDVHGEDKGAVQVPHMTPSAQAHAWVFSSQRADGLGRPMGMAIQTWHFSHGMTVFQASVSGASDIAKPQSSEDVAQAFFRGFHFPG